MNKLQVETVNGITIIESNTMNEDSFKYEAETHWGSGGVCHISRGVINWGSGGINEGYTSLQVAQVMSKAFDMAAKRLELLDK
jgi:hypothetical protein